MSHDETSPTTEGLNIVVDLPPPQYPEAPPLGSPPGPPLAPPAPRGTAVPPATAVRVTTGWVLGLVTEAVLLLWLVGAATGDSAGEDPASSSELFWSVVFFGGLASVFVVAAAVTVAKGRMPVAAMAATVMLFIATVIGFFGGFLIALSKQDVGDH